MCMTHGSAPGPWAQAGLGPCRIIQCRPNDGNPIRMIHLEVFDLPVLKPTRTSEYANKHSLMSLTAGTKNLELLPLWPARGLHCLGLLIWGSACLSEYMFVGTRLWELVCRSHTRRRLWARTLGPGPSGPSLWPQAHGPISTGLWAWARWPGPDSGEPVPTNAYSDRRVLRRTCECVLDKCVLRRMCQTSDLHMHRSGRAEPGPA